MIFHTVHEAAAIIRVKPGTLRGYIDRGLLTASRVGKNGPWRVEDDDLREFMGLPRKDSQQPARVRVETYEERVARVLSLCGAEKKRKVG